MKTIQGIAASRGVVIAKAYKLEDIDLDFAPTTVENKENEIAKFKEAISTTVNQLDEIKIIAAEKIGDDAEVFEAHKSIVLDPELESGVVNAINDGTDAATATKTVTDTFIMMFESMDNEYFKERAADVKDVRKRLIANVQGLKIPTLSTITEEVIVVAEDLTPSETSQLNKDITLGFVTNIGGRTSHAAIMARSMEIPAIVGTQTAMEDINDGDIIILDATTGDVIINPTEELLSEAKTKQEELVKEKEMMKKFMDLPSVSKDGHHVEIVGNIGTPADAEGVNNNGGEGVGLYRTEFLYMDASELPTEDEQFNAYKSVLESMGNKPVVVRTLDIGGDKELPYLKFPEEMNPFLGYRAIRLCLDRTDIFETQIRALLRASVYGNLKIMFPMIATLGEYREAKKMVMDQKEILLSEGHKVSDDIEIGIMVEIPSTAMMADTFAKEVDFFSIGTNDLIQYTMACDRMSEKISYLYQPYNPAILRMVKNVVDAANAEGKWAGMCGEMASDPVAIAILLGLGLHEFSMSASAILPSRMLISELDKKEIEGHIPNILNLTTADEVEVYVKENILK